MYRDVGGRARDRGPDALAAIIASDEFTQNFYHRLAQMRQLGLVHYHSRGASWLFAMCKGGALRGGGDLQPWNEWQIFKRLLSTHADTESAAHSTRCNVRDAEGRARALLPHMHTLSLFWSINVQGSRERQGKAPLTTAAHFWTVRALEKWGRCAILRDTQCTPDSSCFLLLIERACERLSSSLHGKIPIPARWFHLPTNSHFNSAIAQVLSTLSDLCW